MVSSCIDESSSTSESFSPATATPTKFSAPPLPPLPMGSGGSNVVLDSKNGVEMDSRKLPSSKYKGVVPQPNGRWGAQIYSNKRKGANTNTTQNDTVLKRTREMLFEKVVTPSDVGKLNRLVIPKQHAEKHFPLPSLSVTKGVLINFEDVTGKVWRFRYSYWNSSQSYVLTKGWSRFVKEKNLRAGDVVTFERSTGSDRQLCIGWKIRSGPSENPVQVVVRLFGVDIFNVTSTKKPSSVVDACGGKRSRDVDMFALRCSKKHAIINAL
ncbi:hypothetical protein Bca101_027307 [Brassica carinata]